MLSAHWPINCNKDRPNALNPAMAATTDTPRKLWEHPSPQTTEMWKFKSSLEKAKGINLPV